MNRRDMLAATAGAAASTPLPFELTPEEAEAYKHALAHHDTTNIEEHGATRLWGRWFAVPDEDSRFPGMCLAPQEFVEYKAQLERVIALNPDLLDAHSGPHPITDHRPIQLLDRVLGDRLHQRALGCGLSRGDRDGACSPGHPAARAERAGAHAEVAAPD